jgi:hypothetical protein
MAAICTKEEGGAQKHINAQHYGGWSPALEAHRSGEEHDSRCTRPCQQRQSSLRLLRLFVVDGSVLCNDCHALRRCNGLRAPDSALLCTSL